MEKTAKILLRWVSFPLKLLKSNICDLKNPEEKIYKKRNSSYDRAILPLNLKTKEGYIMTYSKFLDSDPSKFNFNESLKYFFMTCEVQNMINGTSNGQVIIFDATGLSFGHVAQINMMIIKKILFYIQEAIPVRLKAIHILNTMPIMDIIMNMIKPFLKAEMLKLVSVSNVLSRSKKYNFYT